MEPPVDPPHRDPPPPANPPPPVASGSTLPSTDSQTPSKKADIEGPPIFTAQMIREARIAVLGVQSKLHAAQAFFSDMEGRAAGMSAVFSTQSAELRKVKDLLGME